MRKINANDESCSYWKPFTAKNLAGSNETHASESDAAKLFTFIDKCYCLKLLIKKYLKMAVVEGCLPA